MSSLAICLGHRFCISSYAANDLGLFPRAGAIAGKQRLPSESIGTASLTLTGLVSGSDITFLESGTENILLNIEDNTGTTCEYQHEVFSPTVSVDISIYKPGYMPHTAIRNFPLTISATSLPISQTPDLSPLE